MPEVFYVNGEILPVDKQGISVFDRGLLYGDGIFETLRIYHRRPFALDRHFKRLLHGASVLGIPLPGEETLKGAVMEVLEANILQEGSLRLSLTRGTGVELWPEKKGNCTLVVTARSQIAYTPEHYRRGFKASRVSFPRNEQSPLVFLKTLNFLENILARRESVEKETEEGLFVNLKGRLAEGTVSNLFVVKEGGIFTPPVSAGILPGITREVILELAGNLCIDAREADLTPEDLEKADEAFLTSSLMEIMPLVEIDGHKIGDGRPGLITGRVHRLYKEYVMSCSGY